MNTRGAVRVVGRESAELARRHGIDLARLPEAWTTPPGMHAPDPEAGALPRSHHSDPILNQATCYARSDDGTQITAQTKIFNTTAQWFQCPASKFRLRFVITESAGAADANTSWRLQYNKNAAGWNNVTGASANVQAVASDHVTDGTATTNLSSIGGGTFVAGSVDTADGLASSTAIGASGHTEVEYCAQIIAADVADGDTIQFRVVTGAGVVFTGTYSQILTATVAEEAPFAWSSAKLPYRPATNGPFLFGSAVYAVAVNTAGTRAAVFKASSDPTNSANWSGVGSYALEAVGTLSDICAVVDGDNIVIVHSDVNLTGSLRHIYFSIFDTTTDTWKVYQEDLVVSSISSASGGAPVAIAEKRSDGTFVFIVGTPSATAPLLSTFVRAQSGTGTQATDVVSVGVISTNTRGNPVAVKGASDRVHIFCMSSDDLNHRSVSSANAYDTEQTLDSTAGDHYGAFYDGTDVVCLYLDNTDSNIESLHATSGATPTFTASVIDAGGGSGGNGRGAVLDGSTWHAILSVDATEDLQDQERAGAGGSWSSPASLATTDEYQAYQANIYTRSGSKVIAVLYATPTSGGNPIVYAEFAMASGATVTPATVGLTIGGPTLTPQASSTPTPAAVGLVAAVDGPSVRLDVSRTPDPVAPTIDVTVPSPSAGSSVTPTPVAVAAAVDVPDPQTDQGATRTPDPVALFAGAPTPEPRATAERTPAAVGLIVAVPMPESTAGSIVSPAPVGVVVDVETPAPSAGSTVTPAAVAAAVAVASPSVSAAASVAPQAVAAVVALPTPSPSAGATTTPETVALIVALETPTTQGSDNATATPDPVALVVDVEDPAPSAGASTTPAPVALSAALETPAVSAGASVAPEAVGLVAALPGPSVSAGSTVAPDPVAVVLDVEEPSATAGAATSPQPVALPMAIDAPALSAGAAVEPQPVALDVEVLQPDAGAAARALPESVGLTVALPSPSPSADVSVSPATVALIVSVLQPVISAGATVTPATAAIMAAVLQAAVLEALFVTPDTVTLDTDHLTPTPVLDAAVNPAVVALLLGMPRPTVTGTTPADIRRCDVEPATDRRGGATAGASARRGTVVTPSDRRGN